MIDTEICAEATFFSCESTIEKADSHQPAEFPYPILLTLQQQLEGMGAARGGWVRKGDGGYLRDRKEGISSFAHELHF